MPQQDNKLGLLKGKEIQLFCTKESMNTAKAELMKHSVIILFMKY
jgi:hypothetical protein